MSQALTAEPIGQGEQRGGARPPTLCFEWAPTIMLALSHFAAPKNQLQVFHGQWRRRAVALPPNFWRFLDPHQAISHWAGNYAFLLN